MTLFVLKALSVFPAHAGVIPIVKSMQYDMLGIPRTRGGDPR